MYHEMVEYFNYVLNDSRNFLDLIDSDYTFLNEELANHYGIAGVEGKEMRKVQLTDRRRGGVLGMGSVLASTSMPLRTSPVLRGKWVLEEIMGTPPPPPPPQPPPPPEARSPAAMLHHAATPSRALNMPKDTAGSSRPQLCAAEELETLRPEARHRRAP